MSNVVESQTNISREILASREYLFSNLSSHNISLETFLWNGIMLMENMSKIIDISDISEIPASNSGIQIFLVWDTIYIILLKDIPFGIKIKSFDLANTLHFLFDNMNYSDR